MLDFLKQVPRLIIVILPWPIKRLLLKHFYGYNFAKNTKIGISYVFPKHLSMEYGAKIGHFNVITNVDDVKIARNSRIGRQNWITGFPGGTTSPHFAHDKERRSELIIGKESAITKKHHIDCTNVVRIGDFTTIGGYNSQLLTHSIDIYSGRQDSHPIYIGNYAFISTRSTILGGAKLPDYCALAACGCLTKAYEKEWMIYAGIPAKPVKEIPKDAKYFNRDSGYVI